MPTGIHFKMRPNSISKHFSSCCLYNTVSIEFLTIYVNIYCGISDLQCQTPEQMFQHYSEKIVNDSSIGNCELKATFWWGALVKHNLQNHHLPPNTEQIFPEITSLFAIQTSAEQPNKQLCLRPRLEFWLPPQDNKAADIQAQRGPGANELQQKCSEVMPAEQTKLWSQQKETSGDWFCHGKRGHWTITPNHGPRHGSERQRALLTAVWEFWALLLPEQHMIEACNQKARKGKSSFPKMGVTELTSKQTEPNQVLVVLTHYMLKKK